MSDLKELLDREARLVEEARDALGSVLRRHDRKRRNQRIAAGVVGIAVFVAALWVVTTGLPFDRSQTEVVPGGAGTGPAETGPTGSTVASPNEWDGHGLPPEGTPLSTPVEGQPILEQSYGGEVRLGERTVLCPYGCRKWYHTFRIVYADGRMLWWNDLRNPGSGGIDGAYVLERRLTPEGVDLVRSGADPHDLPNSAWADAEARSYAPPRYSVCFWANGVRDPSANPLLRAVDLLPAEAKALLGGSDPDPLHPGCLVVSTKEARAFYENLSGMGLEAAADLGGVTPGATAGAWLLPDAERILGEPVGIYLHPLWPDGDWHQLCCA